MTKGVLLIIVSSFLHAHPRRKYQPERRQAAVTTVAATSQAVPAWPRQTRTDELLSPAASSTVTAQYRLAFASSRGQLWGTLHSKRCRSSNVSTTTASLATVALASSTAAALATNAPGSRQWKRDTAPSASTNAAKSCGALDRRAVLHKGVVQACRLSGNRSGSCGVVASRRGACAARGLRMSRRNEHSERDERDEQPARGHHLCTLSVALSPPKKGADRLVARPVCGAQTLAAQRRVNQRDPFLHTHPCARHAAARWHAALPDAS